MNSIVDKFAKKLSLEKIDEYESLGFLEKNYNVKPSHIVSIILCLGIVTILVIDGTNIIASVACFLVPLLAYV